MRALFIALCITMFCQTSFAANGLAPSSTTVSEELRSSYMLSNGKVASSASISRSSAMFSWKNVYVELAWITPLREASKNPNANETNIIVGYRGEVGIVNTLIGISHNNLYPINNIDSNDRTEIFGELSPKDAWQIGKFLSLAPYGRFEIKNNTAKKQDNSTVTFLGLRGNSVINENWSITQKLQLSFHPEVPKTKNEGTIGTYRVDLKRKFGDAAASVYVEHFHPVADMGANRKQRNVLGGIISFKF